MATLSISSLLTLPSSSNAFSSFTSTTSTSISTDVNESAESVSASSPSSPVRKVARLDTDSDSASASRYRSQDKGKGKESDVPAEGASGGRKRGVARMKITGPSYATKVAPQFSEESLRQLQRCIINILAPESPIRPLPLAYERIYEACRYLVCAENRGETLETTLKSEVQKSLGVLVGQLLNLQTESDMEWIAAFVDCCARFEDRIALTQNLLAYLDRVYMIETKRSQGVKELTYMLFAERVLESEFGILERLKRGLNEWISFERVNPDTPHPQRDAIASLIKHLHIHNRYQAIFESHYLSILKDFYISESSNLANKSGDTEKDVRKFVLHCDGRIEEEMKRSREVLKESSWGIVRSETEYALMEGRLKWLARDGMQVCISKKDKDGLRRLYNLLDRVDGKKELLDQFKICVEESVRRIVKAQDSDDEMVDRLLTFKRFALQSLDQSFSSDPTFRHALQDAFTTGFKSRRIKPAEMIAKYVDRMLRKGQKAKTDEKFEAELAEVLDLYRSTDDKDVFRMFYQRALAKRLLLQKSASDDVEKAILKKLKEQYDPEFGMGDHMFTDLSLSRDLGSEWEIKRAEWKNREEWKPNMNVEGKVPSVMILQQSVWPFASRKGKTQTALPPDLQSELDMFTEFYKTVKFKGRTLDWDHALGTVTLTANFPKGTKNLTVSLYQAIVLLLFNSEKELSYGHIKDGTAMELNELQRTLQSLACGKKKVLKKTPVGKEVNETDSFVFNEDFTDPYFIVHINSIQSKETAEETSRTEKAIESDRKSILDAAIVRIMKAKKTMPHHILMSETIEAVNKHFKPDVVMIKERITSLTEQEYMERDEDNRNLYRYLA